MSWLQARLNGIWKRGNKTWYQALAEALKKKPPHFLPLFHTFSISLDFFQVCKIALQISRLCVNPVNCLILIRQLSLIPNKRNIPGWGELMKLYVLSGPKETKHICLMLDPERFPYIVTWPSICLMHAEEVVGRWSWRSMAQRYY